MKKPWILSGWWMVCWSALAILAGSVAAVDIEKTDAPLVSFNNDNVIIGRSAHVKPDEHCEQLVVISGSANVEGTIDGDLVLVNSSVDLSGTVKGNVVVVLSTGQITPSTVVEGDVVSVLGSVRIEDGAQIHGKKTEVNLGFPGAFLGGLKHWVTQGLFYVRPLPPRYAASWIVVGLFLLFYALISLLFLRPIQACVTALEDNSLASFLAGLLVLLLFGPVVLLLVVSVAGIVVVPFLVCGMLALGLFGKVALLQYTGRQLGQHTTWAIMRTPLVSLVVGTAVFCVIYMIPVLGFLVWGLTVPFCLGAGLVAMIRSFKSGAGRSNGGATNPMPSPVPGAQPPPLTASWSQMDASLLPRAGFWLRLWATLLDLLLILVVLEVLHVLHGFRSFLAVWIIYHVAMWSWRGTTIGGTICHLKMVRWDGRPVGVAVALVRCLAAFLSGMALGLGFFWVAWSKDRQSWHDKIAGTLIVKTPSGMPLI